MKEKLRQIVDTFHRYNSEHMAMQAFGLSDETEYDALVIAPSFTPYRLHIEPRGRIPRFLQLWYLHSSTCYSS